MDYWEEVGRWAAGAWLEEVGFWGAKICKLVKSEHIPGEALDLRRGIR